MNEILAGFLNCAMDDRGAKIEEYLIKDAKCSFLESNIKACCEIASILRSTYGPRGMDKLITDQNGNMNTTNGFVRIIIHFTYFS